MRVSSRVSSTVLRTWALRGAAGFVLVCLVGAWVVGLARNGGDDAATDDTAPAGTDTSQGPAARSMTCVPWLIAVSRA